MNEDGAPQNEATPPPAPDAAASDAASSDGVATGAEATGGAASDAATPGAATPDGAASEALTPGPAAPDGAASDATTPDPATPDGAASDATTPGAESGGAASDAAIPAPAAPDGPASDTATPDAATPDGAAADAAPTDAPTNLLELLDGLVEPAVPVAVPMTPQTAGWAVLAGLLVIALAVLVVWRVRRWRADRYRRAALAELAAAGEDPAAIALILRRTALAAWPRERVAGLAGQDWLAFLDRTGADRAFADGAFAKGSGRVLLRAPYRACPPEPGLAALAARWVRRHRVQLAGTPEAAP